MWTMLRKSLDLPSAETALPGRANSMPVPAKHYILGHPLKPPFPAGLEQAVFGLGCFWGAERKFWHADGVYTTGSYSDPSWLAALAGSKVTGDITGKDSTRRW